MRTEQPVDTAWQRFLKSGPLALLPVRDNHSNVVWSTTVAEAARLEALSPQEFALEVNQVYRFCSASQMDAQFTCKAALERLMLISHCTRMDKQSSLQRIFMHCPESAVDCQQLLCDQTPSLPLNDSAVVRTGASRRLHACAESIATESLLRRLCASSHSICCRRGPAATILSLGASGVWKVRIVWASCAWTARQPQSSGVNKMQVALRPCSG